MQSVIRTKLRQAGVFIALFCALPALTLFHGCRGASEKTIVIRGSTTLEPLLRKAAEAYEKRSKVTISVTGSGSREGIRALIQGECDISDSSTGIETMELARQARAQVGLKAFVIAYDLIVPIVNPKNEVNNLTLEQLKGVFSGTTTSWSALGGRDAPIKLAVRDENSGTATMWKALVSATPPDDTVSTHSSNSGVLHTVAGDPDTIGYVGLSFLNSEVRALKINGVEAGYAEAKSGKYPLKRKLYLYVNEKTIDPAARSFIVFLLSREGQEIVRESGYIPVHDMERI
ncbi:MAG: PstS family phosphate ABC transporter substrate-binding protein [Spirochaetes bacterium]|nr:PstS family phosphate ABC transporter substrate-binding protein [Spirochaetota bacterium]